MSDSDALLALQAHIAKLIELNPHTYQGLQSYRVVKRRERALRDALLKGAKP